MKPSPLQGTILGIETSCDECSASLVHFDFTSFEEPKLQTETLSTFSQTDLHEPFGGVVPEVASRNHLETINAMIERALPRKSVAELSAVAVTNRPGLVGALLVGVSAAKALAWSLEKPLVAVHHLEGHALSGFLDQPQEVAQLPYPTLIAVISGGHSNLYVLKEPPERWSEDQLARSLVSRSRDDAAGEAFDKTAKLLGFPYPGGVWIDRYAQKGNAKAFAFPRALPQKNVLDFSFSGLKTAVSLEAEKLRKQGSLPARLSDLCASVQEAIVDALISKMALAVRRYECKSLFLVGGVAANTRLRSRLAEEASTWELLRPPILPLAKYCTDNAAMIAAAGAYRFAQNQILTEDALLNLGAFANPAY